MSSKSRFWNQYNNWEEAEQAWDEKAKDLSHAHPLKSLKVLPKMPGMTPDTKRGIRRKALKYMIQYDEGGGIRKHVVKHPLKYAFNYLKSVSKKNSYHRDQDFFFYGLKDEREFLELLNDPHSLFVLGFSYCHKPFECPSGRFTDQCMHDSTHPVCGQCFNWEMHAQCSYEKL